MKMQTYKYTIPAGGVQRIPAAYGRYVRGLASDGPYKLSLGEGDHAFAFQTGLGLATRDTFYGVVIENTLHGDAQTVEISVSDGTVEDSRLVGQVDISGGIRLAANRTTSYGSATVDTVAVEVLAANSNRGQVLLQNLGAATVYVGTDSGVTVANGVAVAPGAPLNLTVTGPVWAISGSAGQDVRYLEETL